MAWYHEYVQAEEPNSNQKSGRKVVQDIGKGKVVKEWSLKEQKESKKGGEEENPVDRVVDNRFLA